MTAAYDIFQQPPGVDDDDPESLPDLHSAAERILEYARWFGDGLVDKFGGQPLFARDLQAVAGAILRVTTFVESMDGIEAIPLENALNGDRK